MKIIKFIGVLALTSGMSSAFAEQIQVSTSFTCSTNADCKKKCEALGRDHTWNSRQRTCTKRRKGINIIKPTPLTKEELNSLPIRSKISNKKHLSLDGIYGQECYYLCVGANIAWGVPESTAHARCQNSCGISMPAPQYEMLYQKK
mgnify:CR=1 FL=1